MSPCVSTLIKHWTTDYDYFLLKSSVIVHINGKADAETMYGGGAQGTPIVFFYNRANLGDIY